jgi:hypothetical protein
MSEDEVNINRLILFYRMEPQLMVNAEWLNKAIIDKKQLKIK